MVLFLILFSVLLPATLPASAHEADPHSVARPHEIRVTHLNLDLRVDFVKNKLLGKVVLTLENLTKANKLLLDSRGLKIHKITQGLRQKSTSFRNAGGSERLGEGLEIDVDPQTKIVTIEYETQPEAEALQWLAPEQTAGKRFPFLFSQSQPVYARTWIPLQDTPEARVTYDAVIHTESQFLAVMSAENPQRKNNAGTYRFHQGRSIPPYLIALAVGNLEFGALGARTGIYAEPESLTAAQWEFANVEKMLAVGEQLFGPYLWGRFDMLLMPPSFPFGGMENARLTFLTPTLLAGDRSLENVVAHELAHSWTGNSTTNSNGNHFWLNEGFTVYAERRILAVLSGPEIAEIHAQIGLTSLREAMAEQPRLSKLRTDLSHVHPDDAYSDIPYEKGYLFLRHIEEVVGRLRFDSFLKEYLKVFAFQSIDTDDFLSFLDARLIQGDEELRARINALAWIDGEGLPADAPVIESPRMKLMERMALDFVDENRLEVSKFQGISTYEWVHFLKSIPKNITREQIQFLEDRFAFTHSRNAEILTPWLELAIPSALPQVLARTEGFLKSVGRQKFILPLYRSLLRAQQNELATRIFAQAKSGYHSIAVGQVGRIFAEEAAPARQTAVTPMGECSGAMGDGS